MIENPNYKGKWVAPDIDNPEYVHDDTLYHHPDIGFVAFELWQVGLSLSYTLNTNGGHTMWITS